MYMSVCHGGGNGVVMAMVVAMAMVAMAIVMAAAMTGCWW
jgi:hypothetical protein